MEATHSISFGMEWAEVANLSDPGTGNVAYFESERLDTDQEYWYRLKSCNMLNCSKEAVDIKIIAQGKMDNQWQT